MSENTTVIFHDAHRPLLEEGTYHVTLEQSVSVGTEKEVTTAATKGKPASTALTSTDFSPVETLSKNLTFHVAGPRFSLPSSLVHSVYPPKGGKGDYLADLPKLVLNRSTLPWERSPGGSGVPTTSASWLFLLLIDESELAQVTENNNVELIGDAKSATISQTTFPKGSTTSTETDLGTVHVGGDIAFHQNKFNSLAVDEALVKSLLPASLDELQYLSFARINEGEPASPEASADKKEQAVLMCNRLPKAGSNSTVYLISVENNYDGNGDLSGVSITPTSGSTTEMFFPYYDKWSFHAVNEQLYAVTSDLVAKIKKANPSVDLPDLNSIYGQLFTSTGDFLADATIKTLSAAALPIVQKAAMLPGSTFHGLMSNLSGGFQALSIAPTAADITSVGTVLLPFQQLVKNTAGDYKPSLTNAYYRSPLVAAEVHLGANPKFPTKVEDATSSTVFTWAIPQQGTDLIFKGSGGIDTSYAAAFEVGRLMAINNVAFAKAFVAWKIQTAAAIRAKAIGVGVSKNHIVHHTQATPQDMPASVKDQFAAWTLLKEIPYHYLVPDTSLLPTESLRYFYVDTNWVNAFLCGAFSIGHTVPADLRIYLNEVLMDGTIKYQGFLLNSFAVSGWPDYDVDAYLTQAVKETTGKGKGVKTKTVNEEILLPPTSLIYRKNLSTDITIALYNQQFDELKFHLHHSKVHSGFLYEDGKYKKILNSETKGETTASAVISSSNTVSSLETLASQIKANTVSEFAAGMLEGTPAVQFNIGISTPSKNKPS